MMCESYQSSPLHLSGQCFYKMIFWVPKTLLTFSILQQVQIVSSDRHKKDIFSKRPANIFFKAFSPLQKSGRGYSALSYRVVELSLDFPLVFLNLLLLLGIAEKNLNRNIFFCTAMEFFKSTRSYQLLQIPRNIFGRLAHSYPGGKDFYFYVLERILVWMPRKTWVEPQAARKLSWFSSHSDTE